MPSDLLSAREDDLLAYRERCTRDRERPVSAATWKRRRAAINSFYEWAWSTGRLAAWPYFRRGGGRDVLAWGATADLDVRCLTYQQWRLLRQVGLRGLLPGGDADRSFRGAAPLRNCAAAELAVTTGMGCGSSPACWTLRSRRRAVTGCRRRCGCRRPRSTGCRATC